MKTLLLVFLFIIPLNVLSQQTVVSDNALITLKDSTIINKKDSATVSTYSMNDNHSFLAQKYKKRAKNFGIGAIAFTIASLGSYLYSLKDVELIIDLDNSSKGPNKDFVVASVLFLIPAIACTVISIDYNSKAKKELKLSLSGATARLVLTF